MRWVVVLLVVPLLAGCSEPAPEPVDLFAGPMPALAAGDWWRYDVTLGNASHDVRLVYDGARFLIDDVAVGRVLAAHRVPLLAGTYEAGLWNGSFMDMTPSGADEVVSFAWVVWPPVVEDLPRTGSAASRTQTIAMDDATATFRYVGPVSGEGVYDVEAGWLRSLRLDAPAMSWSLVEHGRAYDGERWLVEHRNELDVLLSLTSSYGMDPRGSSVLFMEQRLDCVEPGAADVRVTVDPLEGPWLWYQDTCPAATLRQEFHAADLGDRPRLDFVVAAGDLDVGRLRLVFIGEEQV